MKAGWLLLGLLLAPTVSQAADPSALWKIVSGECVPHEQAARDPAPCSLVDLAKGTDKGFAVLKDINGIAQFLLIPTARIGGIEDPAILAPDAANYWDAAWQARYFVEERLHAPLPRTSLSLAINSTSGRTQDQLHIHIDCIRSDVRTALASGQDSIGQKWAKFPIPLAGHTYRSIRIDGVALDGIDPFRILADTDAAAAADMGAHTLVVVGMTFSNGTEGFILLDDRADLLAGDRASGEQLQDHTCSIADKSR